MNENNVTSETQKLIEQVAIQAPKEFIRIKRGRNYIGLTFLLLNLLSALFTNYLVHSITFCGAIVVPIVVNVLLLIWLRETWKCPVCYEVPGFILSNPKFCNECGSKLEE